jgi:putative sterol carrier protein
LIFTAFSLKNIDVRLCFFGNHHIIARREKLMNYDDVESVFENMPGNFNPDAAGSLDAIFQFEIEGKGGGTWNATVREGRGEVGKGPHDSPSVVRSMDSGVWLSMAKKEISGIQAFMKGQLKVRGDMMLAQRIPELFSF